MKQFIITEDQINLILKELGELPARTVIQSINLLRQLKELENEAESKSPE